jgi:diguanylate cyclase (GGDEF)-like protein
MRADGHEQAIRDCLASGLPFLKFPLAIEREFNDYDWEKRRHRYIFLSICAILLYNLYCIGDRIMLPDIYKTAWLIRLGAVTPLMAAGLVLLTVRRLKLFQEALASFQLLTPTLGLILILALSRHPNVEHYHTGILVIVMFGNIAVRQRFMYALMTSLAVFVIYVFFARHFATMSVDTVQNTGLILLTTILLSLIANYQMEKEARKEYLLTVLQGIDARKLAEANKQLELLSISDSLTGLANRRFFDETLHVEWRAAIRGRYRLSLIFFDIDSFKPYNDNYGHPTGDACLIAIGQVIRDSINRPRDLGARYGGEEFVILLPRTEISDALRMAETIRCRVEALDLEHRYSNAATRVTVSLGVASVCPGQGDQAAMLLKQADAAMYSAKNQGRNRVCLYEGNDGF